MCARCQKDPARAYPTFALAFSLFEGASWEALSPERPLRYWRLIEITQPGGQPLTTSALRADERIVNYNKGLNYLDDRLFPLLTPIDQQTGGTDLPPSHRDTVETIIRRLKLVDANRSLPIVQLLGADAASKQLVAGEVASSVGLQLYRLPAMLLPTQAADIETLARLWQRESLLLPLALYLDTLGYGAETVAAGPSSPVTRLLERMEGAVFLDARECWPGLHKLTVTVDIAKPSAAEQAATWQSALGLAAKESPAQLAAQFNLGFTTIRQLARDALAERADRAPLHDRLWEACLASTRPQLDVLAERINPKATWDDIVLPDAESALLRHIAEQVAQRTTVYEKWGFGEKMSRGLGISALFSGDSGTGKTMAAEVIANDLRLNLYRIDLSAVVSKYIGETEKNLRRMFDAAENGGAILFFDEADALFGKRSEVKDSHDRYANIEINYLLQRMEAYRGLAILATNMKSALDTAFLRRLRFIVRFPFPGTRRAKGDLAESVSAGHAEERARLRPAGASERHRRTHSQYCDQCGIPGGARRIARNHGAGAGRRARRVPQNRTADQRGRFSLAGASGRGSGMKIHLHIERLVLDGVAVDQPRVLRTAMEQELAGRLKEGGLSPELRSGGAVPSVRGGRDRTRPRF